MAYEEAARASYDAALAELFRRNIRDLRGEVVRLKSDPDYQLPEKLLAELG